MYKKTKMSICIHSCKKQQRKKGSESYLVGISSNTLCASAVGATSKLAGAPVGAALSPQEEKGWSLAAHLLVLVAGFLAPLIIWLVFKGRGPFLEHHAKESLNFQITVTIAGIISGLAIFLLIGIVMILALIPWMIIMPIIAAVKANSGEWYRYPLTLRLIK